MINKSIYIFFIVSFGMINAQTLTGVMSFTPKKSLGDTSEISDEGKVPMYFSYTYSGNKSIQKLIPKEKTTIDTVEFEQDLVEQKFYTKVSLIRPYRTIYYKNYQNGSYRLESSKKNENLEDEHMSILDTIPILDWTLSSETKSVSGYTCKKATTQRTNAGVFQSATAWYCEDIPINDGSMDYSGLPGLIMQVEVNDRFVVEFNKIKFDKEKETDIQPPKNATKLLSISDYIKTMMND